MNSQPRRGAPVCALVALVYLATGCSTLQAYEGPARPDSAVARLSPAIMPARQILIQTFDGKPLGALQDRVEMLPGLHEVEAIVMLRGETGLAQFVHRLRFSAQPGREYRLYADLDVYGPRTFIMDEANGAVVAESLSLPEVSAPGSFHRP